MLNIRIIGERLPGRACAGHTNVHIGVQRGEEIVQLQPADPPSVKFTFGIVLRETEDGRLDFRSPFVHGSPGDRFLYLVWVDLPEDGSAGERIGRAKLMLSAIPTGLVTAKTTALEAYVSLTDDKGGPRCAAVRPPAITWTSG